MDTPNAAIQMSLVIFRLRFDGFCPVDILREEDIVLIRRWIG